MGKLLTYRGGALIIVLLWALLLPISNPRVYAVDEVGYYVYLRSLYFDADLDFENEYRTLDALNPRAGIAAALLKPGPIKDGGRRNPITGLWGNAAPIGAALLWSPFYVAADIGVRVANALGAGVAADGYSKPYVWAVCYASALYGLLGLLLCHRLALGFVAPFAATLATATVWLASPLVFYMVVQMPWSHATGLFAVACFLAFWHHTRGRRRLRDWFVLGLLAGLMTLVREQLVLFGLVVVVEAMQEVRGARSEVRGPGSEVRGPRSGIRGQGSEGRDTAAQPRAPASSPFALRSIRPLSPLASRLVPSLSGYALCALAFLLAVLPQLVVYQVLNGRMRPNTEVSGKFRDTWYSPCFFHTLVDPTPCLNSPGGAFSHGALLWSPVLALGLVGLLLLWRRDRLLTLALGVALVAQLFVNGSIYTWHQSGAFGFRRLIECSPIFILGLALLIERWTTGQAIQPQRARGAQSRTFSVLGALRALRLKIPALALALLLIAWNMGLIFNWTVGHTELRRGLDWRNLVAWQLDVPQQAAAKLGTLLFDRCKLLENQGCESGR